MMLAERMDLLTKRPQGTLFHPAQNRAAWEALGAITGQSATEDVVDRIFEKFCLGK